MVVLDLMVLCKLLFILVKFRCDAFSGSLVGCWFVVWVSFRSGFAVCVSWLAFALYEF